MKAIFVPIVCLVLALFSQHSLAQTTPAVQGVCIEAEAHSTNDVFDGISLLNFCSYPVATYVCEFGGSSATTSCTLASTQNGTPSLVNGGATILVPEQPQFPGGGELFIVDYECPAGFNTESGNFSTASGAPPCTQVTSSNIAASVLPSAFASQIDKGTPIFATAESTGASLQNCRVSLVHPLALSTLQFSFQQTNPSTNAPVGSPNTAISISPTSPGTFVLDFASTSPFQMQNFPLIFSCDGSVPMLSTPGLSSVDVDFTSAPTANIVAEAETTSQNGTLTVPVGGASAFAVATDNAGNAGATVTVQPDTGNTSLPVTLTVCQTNSSTGACLATPASSLSISIAEGATPTFSVFATVSGTIALSPAANRVFLRFKVSGTEVGATSVAIQS